MQNFEWNIPTVIEFGKGAIEKLSAMAESGSRALLVYGGGSIKRTGIYDDVMKVMNENGITVFELSGVEPNPRIQTVRKGVDLCKAEGIDMVLAVGGGSSIDCAKVVAAGALYDGDAWDLVLDANKITKCLPVYTVLTMSATGSEMNKNAVISDLTKNEKWGTHSPLFKPRMSILDPTYTFSVPKKHTAAGTADIMSHTFENYFNFEDAALQKTFAEGILKTCIKYGPIAIEEPDNYEARANLMWASTNAINGLIGLGSSCGWSVHPIEHELSAFYDITHGEGLAILTPAWMEAIMKKDPRTITNIAVYGQNVWNLTGNMDTKEGRLTIAQRAVEKTREFFVNSLGIPGSLHEVGIEDEEHFEKMAEKASAQLGGAFVPLSKDEVVEIYRAVK